MVPGAGPSLPPSNSVSIGLSVFSGLTAVSTDERTSLAIARNSLLYAVFLLTLFLLLLIRAPLTL